MSPNTECGTVLRKGRREESWDIIAKLHGGVDDDSMIYAREEFYQMTQQVQIDEAGGYLPRHACLSRG